MSRQAPATHGDANVADWYRDHFARLTRLAACMLGGTEGAEDVAQEALLRAWEHRDALDHPDAIGPWLARVARNLCIDVLRNGRDVVPLGDADPPAEPVIPPIDADPVVDVRRALSTDPMAYGIKATRKVLDTIADYVHAQGLTDRRVKIEELFAPVAMDL